jgi:hypothetical protein
MALMAINARMANTLFPDEASTEFSLCMNKRGGAASLAPAHLAVASILLILSDSLHQEKGYLPL